jgi:hypothetical protein
MRTTDSFVFYDIMAQFLQEASNKLNAMDYVFVGNWSSSVSIVSDYGLDDRAIGVRSPAGAKDFASNICVQTGSGAYPASCTMGNGDAFPGGKARPGRDANHSPHLVPMSRVSRSYTSSPPTLPHGV